MEILGLTISESVLWLALIVVFLLIEALTVGLTTIWFAVGALAALILSLLGAGLLPQVIVFLAVSVCLLVFTRKIFVEKLKTGSESTNVDALIGRTGTVISRIEPHAAGRVMLDNQDWSAICRENVVIEEQSLVKVRAIEGVKLIVAPVDKAADNDK